MLDRKFDKKKEAISEEMEEKIKEEEEVEGGGRDEARRGQDSISETLM